MPTTSYNINDVLSTTVVIRNTNNEVVANPWGSTILLESGTLDRLINSNQDKKIDIYLDIIGRLSFIKDSISQGYTVELAGNALTGEDIFTNLTNYEKQITDLFSASSGSSDLNRGIFRSLTPNFKKKGLPSTSSSLNAAKKLIEESENRALSAFLGSEDIALQIGWMTFGSSDSNQNVAKLGPDKISLADINEVRTAGTVRSDTDVAIKGNAGRSLLDVDIVFPTTESINGSPRTPGLRELLGLLRMAPMIPVGGRAISSMLLNQIQSKELYSELIDLFFKESSKNNTKTIEEARESLSEQSRITYENIVSILENERDLYNLLKRNEKKNKKSLETKQIIESEEELNAVQSDITEREEEYSLLIPLVCTSISVSTLRSAPGALRVRLSFEKFYNPYKPKGGLSFFDKDGNQTYDIGQAEPLKRAVRSVFLSPNRRVPDNKLRAIERINEYYIPEIGDKSPKVVGSEKDPTYRVRVTDLGHNEFSNAKDDKWSPIMFRFAPVNEPSKVFTYIPYDMVLTNVSWAYSNKIVPVPMEGEIYTAFQYMGRASVNAALSFSTTSDKAVSKFKTIKDLIDEHSRAVSGPDLFRREFLDAFNDVLNLSGIARWIISSVRIETDNDQPGLYHIAIQLISNAEAASKKERIEFETSKAPPNTLLSFWWWLYGGAYIKYKQNQGESTDQNIFELIDTDSNVIRPFLNKKNSDIYTQSEIDSLWDLMFGNSQSDKYLTGFLEQNIYIATFLKMMEEGNISIDGLDSRSAFRQYRENASTIGSPIDSLPRFLKEALQTSYAGARENTFSNKGLSTQFGVIKDYTEMDQLLFELSGSSFNTLNSSWMIAKGKGAISGVLYGIGENINQGANKNPVELRKKIEINANAYGWMPTTKFWKELFYMMNKWNRYVDSSEPKTINGDPLPARVQTDSILIGSDENPYVFSKAFRNLSPQLSGIASNPKLKAIFPSFWKIVGYDPRHLPSLLSLKEDGPVLSDINIDPSVFDSKNNYPDIPLPRYSEAFGDFELTANTVRPLKDANGFEIWRKVAPTYLELGVKPPIFSSLSSVIDFDRGNVEMPGLITPRSFFDYCDPGFFYYKTSWINENYSEILESINQDVDVNKTLSALPNGENFSLTSEEKLKTAKISGSGAESIIKIGRPNFDISNYITPQERDVAVGARSIQGSDEIDMEGVAKYFAKNLQEELINQIGQPTPGHIQSDLQRLYELRRGKVGRIFILDGNGRKIGALVSDKSSGPSGNIVELKDLESLVNSRSAITGENSSGKIYYIDLSSSVSQSPKDVIHSDNQGVFSQNRYSPDSMKAHYKDIINNMGDLGKNSLRAYPTCKLYFVRERVEGDSLVTELEEDMYGYNSIISIHITDDKEDAATANIVLTDILGNLSFATFSNDNSTLRLDSSEKDKIASDGETDLLDQANRLLEKRIKLEIGTNIVIKMGYGNDPDTLKTVFTGAIAEISYGAITNIIAQGYKTELFRQVNVYSDKTFSDTLLDSIVKRAGFTGSNHVSPVDSNMLVFRILQDLATMPALMSHDSAGGIPHLGRFISFADYNALRVGLGQESYSDDFQRRKDASELASDNTSILSTVLGFAAGAASARFLKGGARIAGITTSSLVGGVGIAGLAGYGLTSENIDFLRRYSKELMHTNAMRNVLRTSNPTSDNWWNIVSKSWLVDTDGWSALKEVTRYKVGYVCQVLPFGNAATLFIGKPTEIYHYKPITKEESDNYELSVPFQNIVQFQKLFQDIISKFFTSSIYKSINQSKAWLKTNFELLGISYNPTFNEFISKEIIEKINRFKKDTTANIEGSSEVLTSVEAFSIFDWLKKPTMFSSLDIATKVISSIKNQVRSVPSKDKRYMSVRTRDFFKDFYVQARADKNILFGPNGTDDFVLLSPLFVRQIDEEGNVIDFEGSIYDAFNYIDDFVPNASNTYIEKSRIDSLIDPKNLNSENPRFYWGVKRNGAIVGPEELKVVYNIDPTSGKPYRGSFKERGPTELSMVNYNFATSAGSGTLVIRPDPFGRNDLERVFFNPNQEVGKEINIDQREEDSMILLGDNNEDLLYIRNIDEKLEKILFASFFGITYTPDQQGNPVFVGFSSFIESIWRQYNDLVMRGQGTLDGISTKELSQLFRDKRIGLSSLIPDENTKWRSIANQDRLPVTDIDFEQIARVFDAEIRNKVQSGTVTSGDIDSYREKFNTLVSTIKSGKIGLQFIDTLRSDPGDFVNSAMDYVLNSDDSNYNKIRAALSSYSSITKLIISNPSAKDQSVIDLLSKAINRDPLISPIDMNSVGDIDLLNNFISSMYGTDIYNRFIVPVLRYMKIDDVSLRLENNLKETLSSSLDREPGETKGLALYHENSTVLDTLIENADYYKLFLLYFVKWSKLNRSSDKDMSSLKTHNAVKKKIGSDLPPGTKKFSETHFVMSGVDIIENAIVTTMSEMANNILLMSPRSMEIQEVTETGADAIEGAQALYKYDEAETKLVPYPNYQYNGVDWNPFIRPELRKQRLVIERNAIQDQQRLALLINHMADAIRPMYRGHLKIIGRNIKPYDKIFLVDTNNSIFGIIEAERVTHAFSMEEGWTTTIVPHAYINALEPSAELENSFSTKAMTVALTAMGAFDTVLDVWFWAGIALAPFSGGATAAPAAGSKVVGTVAKNVFVRALQKAIGGAGSIGSKLIGKNTAANLRGIGQKASPHISFSNLGSVALSSLIGKRFATFAALGLASDALKFGTSIYMNTATDLILKSSMLPIHAYCLTRYGRPIHAGLDMDVTSWYTWSERFGYSTRNMFDNINGFIEDAFRFAGTENDRYDSIYKILGE